MKNRTKPYLSLSLLISLLVSANVYAQKDISKIVLSGKNDNFSVRSIDVAEGGDEICVAGSYFDDAGPKTIGKIGLIDVSTNKLLWKKKVEAPEDNWHLYFLECRMKGDFIYALANVESSHALSMTQGSVYVYKFDRKGNKIAQRQVSLPGRDAWAYTLDVSEDELKVYGSMRDRDENNEYYSTFLSKFDAKLKFSEPALYKTGAYAVGSAANILNKNIYMAGTFFPHKSPLADGASDYANSRIRLGGNYVWSVRPQHTSSENIDSTVSDAGTIYSIGYKGYSDSASFFTAVYQNGKLAADVEYKSSFCRTSSLTAGERSLFSIRSPCNAKNGKSVLVSFDMKQSQERAVAMFSGDPSFVFTKKSRLYVVGKEPSGSVVLQYVAIDNVK
jgi:hypothetical protein